MQHFLGCQRRLFVGKWLESGRLGADSGVGGDPCVRNEKSPRIDLCSLVEGLPVRPLAILCGVCAGQLPFDTPRVREHPAPSGALRLDAPHVPGFDGDVREHPAPSGALRPSRPILEAIWSTCQGAPSTIRCIETMCLEDPASWYWTMSGSTQHHQVH